MLLCTGNKAYVYFAFHDLEFFLTYYGITNTVRFLQWSYHTWMNNLKVSSHLIHFYVREKGDLDSSAKHTKRMNQHRL